jgi:coenzyme F420-reducing hydrogenase delta subunit
MVFVKDFASHDPCDDGEANAEPNVTAFVCVNCAHANGESARRRQEAMAEIFPRKTQVKEVVVPCTGRLQPEHLLRAIEAGADLVCIVACEENNCHFLEGSKRVRRRAEYVQHLLEEINVGGERILLLHLPGSARQDMDVKAGRAGADEAEGEWSRYVLAATAEVAERLRTSPYNPLHRPRMTEEEFTDLPAEEESEENED